MLKNVIANCKIFVNATNHFIGIAWCINTHVCAVLKGTGLKGKIKYVNQTWNT